MARRGLVVIVKRRNSKLYQAIAITFRVAKIFVGWLIVASLMGMAYSSHIGFDSTEVRVLATILAVGCTAYWLYKFPKPVKIKSKRPGSR